MLIQIYQQLSKSPQLLQSNVKQYYSNPFQHPMTFSYPLSHSAFSSLFSMPYIFPILSLVWSLMLTLPLPTSPQQCTYNPSNFSVSSVLPVNPLTNCRQYCIQFYSNTPQRVYYNITSKNCQPIKYCTNDRSYYNYNDNQCYQDETLKQKVDSYMPETIIQAVHTWSDSTVEMVCLNGNFVIARIGAAARCICEILWDSSYKVDMNGFKIYCDVATTTPQNHFPSQISRSKNGTITNYGPFTSSQMQILLSSLKTLQQHQTQQYVLNNTQSILYAVEHELAQEPLVRAYEYPILGAVGAIGAVVWFVSYREFQKLRIRISEDKFKRRIMQVIREDNFIREIQ